jgi:hypothetical protein
MDSVYLSFPRQRLRTTTIALSPIAPNIDNGGRCCATIGNVGRTHQLIAAKKQRLNIAHLNIVSSAFQLLACHRWSMEPFRFHRYCNCRCCVCIVALTAWLPLVDGTIRFRCYWNAHHHAFRRSFVPSQPQKLHGNRWSMEPCGRHICCTFATNMPSLK